MTLDNDRLLTWASHIAANPPKVTVTFDERPLVQITTSRVGYYCRLYLDRLRLAETWSANGGKYTQRNPDTRRKVKRGWNAYPPSYWQATRDDNLRALKALYEAWRKTDG